MSAYLVVHRRDISDSERLQEYANGVQATIGRFGGEVIVRADEFDVLEGSWTPGQRNEDSRPERVTVVRFPDMKALKSWYASDDYAGFKEIRRNSSSSDVVAAAGCDAS